MHACACACMYIYFNYCTHAHYTDYNFAKPLLSTPGHEIKREQKRRANWNWVILWLNDIVNDGCLHQVFNSLSCVNLLKIQAYMWVCVRTYLCLYAWNCCMHNTDMTLHTHTHTHTRQNIHLTINLLGLSRQIKYLYFLIQACWRYLLSQQCPRNADRHQRRA